MALCCETLYQQRDSRLRRTRITTCEEIDRCDAALGPGVNGKMGFGEQRDAGDTLGLESVGYALEQREVGSGGSLPQHTLYEGAVVETSCRAAAQFE